MREPDLSAVSMTDSGTGPGSCTHCRGSSSETENTDIQGETGDTDSAAVVAAFRTSEKLPEDFSILKSGLGAGKREYRCPGILRAMLIQTEPADAKMTDMIWKLETDIDDCSGEVMGHVLKLLMENGAREAHYMPFIQRKTDLHIH